MVQVPDEEEQRRLAERLGEQAERERRTPEGRLARLSSSPVLGPLVGIPLALAELRRRHEHPPDELD